jgi:HlyD family secretion protein
MKTLIGLVILAAAVGGVYYLNDLTRTKDGKSRLNVAREVDIPVETGRPEQRDIVRTVQSPGEVEAFAEVDISSQVVAKILEMPVEEGDMVREGDLLCRLDDADYRARVLSAEANVAKLRAMIVQAEADLQKAERDWAQQQRLRETAATSEMELANYRTALIGARAIVEMRNQELIEAEAALQSAKEFLAKTVINAPISGVVAQRFAKSGEVVITGTMNNPGTRVMVISDLSKMQVRCRVDEADAPLVAPDQVARIYLQSDTRRSIPGRVLRVGTKGTKPLGRDVVTFETLVLIVGDDPRVKPGMTANVEIEVARRENALTAPIQAVVYRKRRDLPEALVKEYDAQKAQQASDRQTVAEYIRVIFCLVDGKAQPRLVQTGVSDATSVELVEGVALADTLVTGPYRSLDQLKDGSAITPIKKAENAAGEKSRVVAEQATSAPSTAIASDPNQGEVEKDN